MLWKCLLADLIMFAAFFGGGYLTEVFEMYGEIYLAICIAGPIVFGYILAWLLIKMSVGNVGMLRKISDHVRGYRQKEGTVMLIVAGVGVVLLYGMYLYISVFVMLFNNIFLWQAVAVLFTEVFVYFFGSIVLSDNEEKEKSFGKYFRTSFCLNALIYISLICAESMFNLL